MAAIRERLSAVVRQMQPSPIREMFTAAERYDDVISLGIGEPDFHTPTEVSRAALEDALAGHTHYTSSQGDPELRRALSAYLTPRYGTEVPPERILVTVGGMNGLNAFFQSVCDPGDEVIIPEPHFPAYRAMVALGGGSLVNVPTSFDDAFVVRPEAVEAAITPRSKVLLLNSPCNPTGAMIPPATLDALSEIARAHDLLVLSDEVYDRIVFGPVPHESIYTRPGMAERTVVIGSFSKSFAMTGWRLGWAFGPADLIGAMLKVATFYVSCASSVSQRAALAALKLPGSVFDTMVDAFRRRRDHAVEVLRSIPGVDIHPSPGSFYIFPRIAGITPDDQRFALDLLDREQVVTVQGSGFGPSGRGCLRLACTVNQVQMVEAMDRLARFARSYRP